MVAHFCRIYESCSLISIIAKKTDNLFTVALIWKNETNEKKNNKNNQSSIFTIRQTDVSLGIMGTQLRALPETPRTSHHSIVLRGLRMALN